MIRAARQRSVPVLVSGSSEVYGRPLEGVLPLTEASPLRADQPYGLSKRAQEIAALEEGAAGEVPVVVTRSFNHTGPGQRESFVAPALARRVVDAKRRGLREISVGNLDVKRDIGDVRDVVRAYRLLVEGLAAGHVPGGTVVNVATGRAVAIRDLLDLIVRAAGAEVVPKVDAELVRPGEAPLIVGDASRLRALTGWEPTIPLERTVSDLVVSIEAG